MFFQQVPVGNQFQYALQNISGQRFKVSHCSLSQIDGLPIAIFHSFLHFNDCSASKATLPPLVQLLFISLRILNPFSNPQDHCMQWLFRAQHLPIPFCSSQRVTRVRNMTNKGLWFRCLEPGLFDDGDGTFRQWHPRLTQVGELQPEHIETAIIHPSCSQTFRGITVLESRLAQFCGSGDSMNYIAIQLFNMLAMRPPELYHKFFGRDFISFIFFPLFSWLLVFFNHHHQNKLVCCFTISNHEHSQPIPLMIATFDFYLLLFCSLKLLSLQSSNLLRGAFRSTVSRQ